MHFLSWYERVDTLTIGRRPPRSEALLLLDEQFRILGAITHHHTVVLPPFSTGDLFFDLFPTDKGEIALLRRMMACNSETSLLLRAGKRTVLMLCSFFAHTRVLVAAIPYHDLEQLLDFPAELESSLEHVYFSDLSRKRRAPLHEQSMQTVLAWAETISGPIFSHNEAFEDYRALPSLLIGRTRLLAKLCGCDLTYDFSALEYQRLEAFDLPLFIGRLFAVMFAASRLSKDPALQLLCEIDDREGGVLNVCFNTDTPNDHLPELQPLLEQARLGGELFEVAPTPGDPSRLHVRFSFCRKELSFQGVKTDVNSTDHSRRSISADDLPSDNEAPPLREGIPLSFLTDKDH